VSRACGDRGRIVVASDLEYEHAECTTCGAEPFELTEIGRHFES